MGGCFSKQSSVAAPDFNRWRTPPAALGMHLCIGSVYAWSLYNPALTRIQGVAAASADDWMLSQVVWIFMASILFLGLTAAFAGKWMEEARPRVAGLVSAACWSGGHPPACLGIATRQLRLVYWAAAAAWVSAMSRWSACLPQSAGKLAFCRGPRGCGGCQ